MRTRMSGNPYAEIHGQALRVYEFVADGTKSADEIVAAAEIATGLRLRADAAGTHGYVNTSRRPDGSVFVAVVLYEACDGSCGRHSVPLHRAPDLDVVRQAAVKRVVGENPRHRLNDSEPGNRASLRALGFADGDPAMRDGAEFVKAKPQ